MRRRLDAELVRRGLCDSRARAVEAVNEGRVLVRGAPATSPARQVATDEPITLDGPPRAFVSRGGVKLAAALDAFGVDPRGCVCVDVGASTGGFTDCLLQRGAARVFAIDVGRGQLAWSLRTDPRVTVMERTNVRSLGPGAIDPPAGICVADVSFISLTTVAPHLLALAHDDAEHVLLVKPQFEAGRGRVGKGGVVRDPTVHAAVLGEVIEALGGLGLGTRAVIRSPITGADGNVEFLAHARRGPVGLGDAAIAEVAGAGVTTVRAIGLVPHRERPLAHLLAQSAAAWFGEREVEVRIPRTEAEAVGVPHLGVDEEAFATGLDLVCALGGDGTMLHTVQLVYPASVPILGVNAGQLGYLTAIEPEEFEQAFSRLLVGDYTISERMMLEVEILSGDTIRREFGLNEAVLEREQAGHLVRFNLKINGSPFTSYAADGVIVATPTGSTAYSFSARGPIASPALRCLVLTPISAHMLFDRSLVLAEHEELEFEVAHSREVVCAVDGRRVAVLQPGDRVVCRPAAAPLRLVELRLRDFHQILKTKFDLPDR